MKRPLMLTSLLFFFFFLKATEIQDLRILLNSQINNKTIDIPKGTYLLDLTNGKNAFVFSAKKDITINGNGSTIICNRQNQAFQFTNCENVVFSNFIVEYDPPCASQGTIVEMSADKKTWTVELHQGYPTTGIQTDRILVYDKENKELKQNFTTISTPHISTISTSPTTKLQFTINNTATNPVVVGDYVSFSVYAEGNTQAHTFIITSCKNMKFENVTVYDSNCFSFLEYDGEKNHYYRCVVTRKLNDPKYPVDRLRAGIADAFHSKYATIGPIIEECKLEYTGDDCIAINGNFYPVYETNASEKSISFLTKSSNLSDVYVKTDDRFVCVNNNGAIRGRSTVVGVSTTSPTLAQRNAAFAKLVSVIDAESFTYGVKVKLDTWIDGSDAGDVIYSEDRIGSGFKVLRDTVGGNRSRAILIKSAEGIIEGCEIKNSAMSGIALAPEFNWMEAGCPKSIIVRNNTIDNCMFDSNMAWTSQFAALVVVSQAPNGSFAPAGSINNISIYGNRITNCPFPAIGITSTDGVYFANNSMIKSSWDRNHGSNFGVTNNKDLYRVNVSNFSTTIDVNPPAGLDNRQIEESFLYIADGKIYLKDMDNVVVRKFELYNLSGKCMFSTTNNILDVQHLPKGVYVMKILLSNNQLITNKYIL